MVVRGGRPSAADKALVQVGGPWAVCAPLQERPGLNSADAGPAAALEMVRDWVLCKQCRNPLPPCMQMDPAAWSTVSLKYLEVG